MISHLSFEACYGVMKNIDISFGAQLIVFSANSREWGVLKDICFEYRDMEKLTDRVPRRSERGFNRISPNKLLDFNEPDKRPFKNTTSASRRRVCSESNVVSL